MLQRIFNKPVWVRDNLFVMESARRTRFWTYRMIRAPRSMGLMFVFGWAGVCATPPQRNRPVILPVADAGDIRLTNVFSDKGPAHSSASHCPAPTEVSVARHRGPAETFRRLRRSGIPTEAGARGDRVDDSRPARLSATTGWSRPTVLPQTGLNVCGGRYPPATPDSPAKQLRHRSAAPWSWIAVCIRAPAPRR